MVPQRVLSYYGYSSSGQTSRALYVVSSFASRTMEYLYLRMVESELSFQMPGRHQRNYAKPN
jgi:hypothetical protein